MSENTSRNIYVASSWKNKHHPHVVRALREASHCVFNYRESNKTFHWSGIDVSWQQWDAKHYVDALDHPAAIHAFRTDFYAMQQASTFVLVAPSGRSAHLELGWAVGAGRETYIILPEGFINPELMYKMAGHICFSTNELIEALSRRKAVG